MTCERVRDVLDLTLGGTLDAADAEAVGAGGLDGELRSVLDHARACAGCSAHRESLVAAGAALRRAFVPDAAAERAADEALAAAVAARLPGGRVLRRRFPWRAAAAVLVVAAGAAAFVAERRASPPQDPDVAAAEGPGLVPGYAGPRFADVTERSGIAKVNHTGRAQEKDWMVEVVGHGAAAFDMDGDLDLDLFVPDGNRVDPGEHVSNTWKLYRNDGAMRFIDVTLGSGLEGDAWAGAAVAGDVTGDGRADLFVACFGKNRLFANRGGGRFEDVTDAAGVAGLDCEWSTSACLLDADGDGTLDVYVANYADMRRYMNEAGPRGCTWRNMPVVCGPQPLEPQQDRLFLNRGDGTFADATAERLPRLRRYSFQCVALDLNGDSATDVFVAADGHPNVLLLNDGRGRFVDQAMACGVSTAGDGRERAGMGAAVGDMDGDGLTDLFVTNFSHEPNTLYRARGGGAIPQFADATQAAGLVDSDALLGWGVSALDYDCDGALDVLVANGHLYPGVEQVVRTTSYEQPLSLYRNGGKGNFAEVTASAGRALATRRVHRGLVVADFDDDGRLDAFLTVLNGAAVLLRNDGRGAGNSVRLSLRRRDGRTEAAGAHVAVTYRDAAGEHVQARDMLLGSSFGSSEDPRLHFGLGSAERVESVEIRWPHGVPQRLGALEAGHHYEIVEGREGARVVK
jgi:hypothetical protein